MNIVIDLNPETRANLAAMSGMGQKILSAIGRGLLSGGKEAAQHVSSAYLTNQSLRSRTGFLRKAVACWPVSQDEVVVGVRDNSAVEKYKWLLGGETRTIRPKRGRYLTIPIGENLTRAGVARYDSPRDVPGGFFVRSHGKLLFGVRHGKTARARFRPLFVLVKEVTVKGSDALARGVLDNRDDIADAITAEIAKVTA